MMKLMLVVSVLILSGCFQRSAFIEDRMADGINTDVGAVDEHAEVIEGDGSNGGPFFIPQESVDKNYNFDEVPTVRELTGYLTDYTYDEGTRLFYYTLKNALKTKEINFYANSRINYPPNILVTVLIEDNYLKSVKPYKTVLTRRKRSLIGAAKEYFIKVK